MSKEDLSSVQVTFNIKITVFLDNKTQSENSFERTLFVLLQIDYPVRTDPWLFRRAFFDGNDAVWLLELWQSDGGEAECHARVDGAKLSHQRGQDLPDGATSRCSNVLRIIVRICPLVVE